MGLSHVKSPFEAVQGTNGIDAQRDEGRHAASVKHDASDPEGKHDRKYLAACCAGAVPAMQCRALALHSVESCHDRKAKLLGAKAAAPQVAHANICKAL